MRATALVFEVGYGADAERIDFDAAIKSMDGLSCIYKLPPLSETTALAPLFDGCFKDIDQATQPDPVKTPDAPVYLAFTSGSSGEPKGVLHSNNTLLANSRSITVDWNMNAQSVIYSMSPLSHNLGFGAMINAFTVGGALVIHDLVKGNSLVDRLADTGTSFLFGVPTHAIDLLDELEARPEIKLDKLAGFRISGAAVPDHVCMKLTERGIMPQSGYGMTEACSHNYTMPDDNPQRIMTTSGCTCDSYEIQIFDRENHDEVLPAGKVGQIGGRGASLMLGYFNDQAATEDAFNTEGWFMTGDLGWVDEAGYIRITGRKKDVIIRGGHNIFPARVEGLAITHDRLKQVAAFPVADERLGERVCLAAVVIDSKPFDPSDLLFHLEKEGLSKYDMPEFFLKLEAMPLTASGKILKRKIVDWVGEGRVTPRPLRANFRVGKAS